MTLKEIYKYNVRWFKEKQITIRYGVNRMLSTGEMERVCIEYDLPCKCALEKYGDCAVLWFNNDVITLSM